MACLAMGFHIIEISETRILYSTSLDQIYWAIGTILICASCFFGVISIQMWFKKI